MESLKSWIIAAVAAFILGWMLLIFGAVARADTNTIVDFNDMRGYDLDERTFEVTAPISVRIEAVGAGNRKSDRLHAYGWIYNNSKHQLEWLMEYEHTDRGRHRSDLREFNGEIELEPGSYTAYFFSGYMYAFSSNIEVNGLRDLITVIGDAFSGQDRYVDEYAFKLTTESDSFHIIARPLNKDDNTIIRLAAVDDDYYESEGFTLEKEMPLSIYAVGEYSKSDRVMVDYGWIINADSREKVWMMERWNTEPAGGASKNRVASEEITLPKGNYIAYFSTDDSHSPEDWNQAPPYDPHGWGLTISVKDAANRASVKSYVDDQPSRELVSITRVGNNEFESRYFTLKKPATLHIYAIGEYDTYGDGFADYAWIEDANSFDRVWEMTRRNTEHAGGASKNRRFVGNVDLDAGSYDLRYISDGSHSYRHWNASPPVNQRQYGVTIYGISDDFDKSIFCVTDQPAPGENTLVSITEVGDNEERSQEFILTEPSDVLIYSIGEGSNGEMYDYSWIEDTRTGRVVWEMKYRKTRHAGGAKKNRVFNDVIHLDKGTYEAFYITDDSHSFEDWNSARPDDPARWGITITRE